jgi:hypothetical protein
MNNLKSLAAIGRWASAAALAMAVLSGCGGSGGGNTPSNTAPVVAVMLSGMVDPGTAGADVSASAGSVLTLSGGGSTDADGDVLSYKWTLVSKPATSNLVIVNDNLAVASIKPEVAGTYVVSLRVTDSKGAYVEKTATVLIRDNAAPVTNVAVSVAYSGQLTTKPTQELSVGSSIVLDASTSTDAEGDVVTTSWTLIEKPATSVAALTSENATTRFVADVAGVFKVLARGTDPLGAYSETVYVFEAKNNAPSSVVLASVNTENISVAAGYTVSINSYWGYDPAGTGLSYAWSLQAPAGSGASLSSTDGATTQVQPDVLGNYVVKLVLTNGNGATTTYTTNISVKNRRPLAYITSASNPTALPTGPAIHLPTNSQVTLRGTNSSDGDGDALTYSWTLSSKPAGSAAVVASPSDATTQLSVDHAGTYEVLLRVSDAGGAYSEQTMKIEVGNYAPVAVIDRGQVTVLLGASATPSAALSFDEDRDVLTYAWAIDARPAGSTATIAAPTAAALSFTPDVAGSYVASVTVSDGVSSNVSYVNIKVLGSMTSTVTLPFAPLEARYSKGIDRLVFTSTNPNALKIVDPFTGLIKTVLLPKSAVAMNLSPDGKLAGVLQDGVVSLVDLENATLVRSSLTGGTQSEVLLTNAGMAYLSGQTSGQYSDSFVAVIDARTGDNLSSTLGMSGSTYSSVRGLFAGTRNRGVLVGTGTQSEVRYFDLDPATGKVTKSGTSPYVGSYIYGAPMFLTENEDLLFTSVGTIVRTDTFQYVGKLSIATGTLTSLSHASASEETLALVSAPGTWPDYRPIYAANYKRYVGGLFTPDTDLALPLVGGLQSYGIGIFHSSSGKHIALVQTGSATQFGAGVSYYVLTR